MKNLALLMVFAALTLLGTKSTQAQTAVAEDLFLVDNTTVENAILENMPLEKPIAFGPVIGGNISSICGDQASSFNTLFTWMVGAVIQFRLIDNLALQSGLNYSRQGAKYEETNYEGTIKLAYINLPVIARYYIVDGLSIDLGPQVGFLLSATDDYTSSSGFSDEEDVADQTKKVAIAASGGLGYTFKNGLNFGVRYNKALTRVDNFSDEFLDEGPDVKWKNDVVQFYAGFLF